MLLLSRLVEGDGSRDYLRYRYMYVIKFARVLALSSFLSTLIFRTLKIRSTQHQLEMSTSKGITQCLFTQCLLRGVSSRLHLCNRICIVRFIFLLTKLLLILGVATTLTRTLFNISCTISTDKAVSTEICRNCADTQNR